jgi:hypothetical protein
LSGNGPLQYYPPPPMRPTYPAHLILIDLIFLITFSEG